ncbi:type III secretion system chaperone family protein [Actinokineospora pegani]|uniref:hypothetical protein n=1 Tax=Actinokineospora pegani TaxID=2654637 RepID=UPI0012EAA3DF|nr:hypothetical protein [Actinokineospora pegani]
MLFIVFIVALLASLNLFTLVLPRQFLLKRQNSKNAERQAFAAAHGWRFQPFAPELLTRYPCAPFTEHGDRRVAFGHLAGWVDGAWVTAFDFQRRTKRTSYGSIMFTDTNSVETVWTVRLPAPLGVVEVQRRLSFGQDTGLRTADPEFNRQHAVVGGDPDLAARLLTPRVTALLPQVSRSGFAIVGDELVVARDNVLTRTTVPELLEVARLLVALMRALPVQGAPSQQIPPQPRFQPHPQQVWAGSGEGHRPAGPAHW